MAKDVYNQFCLVLQCVRIYTKRGVFFNFVRSQGTYQSSDNVKAVKPALEDSSSRITIVAAPFFSIFTQF
ncbi:hypothetical protein LIER_09463 [Lithospermum erythrorhizon]|uniref:Uncharacterized protein n=1 Tax=Lithospermum erythrorhizon TaxID=34254 RepID=A0AAV3PFU1_LITER